MHLPDQKYLREKFCSMVKMVPDGLDPGVIHEKEDLLALLAGWKNPVLEAARQSGYAVINADNRQVSARTGHGIGNVIYFSIISDNVIVRRHLGVGGTAVFIREGQVLAATGSRANPIVEADRTGIFNTNSIKLEDALAAAAGFLALGIHPGELYHGSFMEEKDKVTLESAAISVQ